MKSLTAIDLCSVDDDNLMFHRSNIVCARVGSERDDVVAEGCAATRRGVLRLISGQSEENVGDGMVSGSDDAS